MRLVGRQNKCPAVTFEAGSNLVFSLEMIISFATGNRRRLRNLNLTDSVLPRGYFSCSSVFLVAVMRRRVNEL